MDHWAPIMTAAVGPKPCSFLTRFAQTLLDRGLSCEGCFSRFVLFYFYLVFHDSAGEK